MQNTNNSSDSVFRDEALPFIMYDQENRKFELTSEAAEFLKNVPAPVGIIAVAGMYRTGKSYLLNRMLLNRSNGFGVGPSVNPCTKGLWMWGRPVSGFSPEGEPINCLIVDTEGLGALDEDSNHDVRIFSLAILLSSYFLYNSVGSIDESALSNLSLVINLTKHIHIKSRGHEETDTDEYSSYFPSFMWIVRDFTLQLVDNEGEAMTSKEYLEKALEQQKGFSDNVESKNRIRRLMKSFFKDRDCQTMIRPLTNEENLQNLAEMEIEELRPEFVEQVLSLRRKVLQKVKPKTISGKRLSGSMMLTLAESYVTAINNGAVPNIESAWNYICKSECGKAVDESLGIFENSLKDNVSHKIPMDEEELRESYEEAKREAIKLFQKKAVGGASEEYILELKQKMKQLYQSLKEENTMQSNMAAEQFLEESYSFIQRKLKANEFNGGFAEYEQDLIEFQNYFMENGPPGPNRRAIMIEFVSQAICDSANYFTKTIQNELNLQSTIAGEHHKNLENQLKELKVDHNKEKEHFEAKLRSSEVEKAELSAIEQSLRENLERLQQEKLETEKELERKLQHDKNELQRETQELKNKLQASESHASEMQRKVMSIESEKEKDKALKEQEITFLERTIEEFKKKETEYSNELIQLKKDNQIGAREMQSKYELQIKALSSSLDEVNEKFQEVQSQLEEVQSKYNYEKQQWTDSQENVKNSVLISQNQYSEMNKTIDELKSKSRAEIDKLQIELQDLREGSKHQEEELESTLKDREEEIKSMKAKFETELAICNQKIEFKEVQCQQLKSQLEDSKKTHEGMINAIENKARESYDGKEMAQKQVEQLKETHNQQLMELQKQYEEIRARLEKQVDELNEKNNDIELKYKLLSAEYDKDTQSMKDQLLYLESQKQKALDQNKSSDNQRLRLLEESEERHKQQIQNLEQELEEREEKAQLDLKEIQEKSEESLAQLKNYYELEKERLEHRLSEEKENSRRKFTAQQDEYEQKIRDDQLQHEEDLEMVHEERQMIEKNHQLFTNQAEHDIGMLSQKVQTLESQLREKEDRLSKEQSLTAQQMDSQLERFNTERKELFAKIETLNHSVSVKDRKLTLYKSKYDSSVEELEKRKRGIDEVKAELNEEKAKLVERIEQLRTKNQELSDSFMQKKLDDGREIALNNQKLEFQERKIEEQQKQIDEASARFEERLAQQKLEYLQESQEAQARISQTKEQLEQKHEQKRKQFKEQEAVLLKQVGEIQKEKAVLEEKLAHSEIKKEEIRSKQEQEIEQLREQLIIVSSQVNKDREIFIQENERLKMALQDLEKEHSEICSSYERDKALWDGKFQFLEQQKDQAKQDLQDATKKFEMSLEQLQKRGSYEKDKNESSQNALLSSIESKYRAQIKEQMENTQRSQADLNERVKTLEKENRQLQNRLQLEQRDKMSDHGSMEKKVAELQTNESRLSREIDDLKAERDRKVFDNQKMLEKERDNFKAKLSDLEQKCKELENKRSTQIFELEKERAKWGLEKDYLFNQKQELQEKLDTLNRRWEAMQRENEKLKQEKANSKRQFGMLGGGAAGGVGASGAYGSKFNATSFGQSLLKNAAAKENSGVTGSQVFTQGFSKYIGDGSSYGLGTTPNSEKPDPRSLPVPFKDSIASNMATRFGSAFAHTKNASSGGASFKSGQNNQTTDETGSNKE